MVAWLKRLFTAAPAKPHPLDLPMPAPKVAGLSVRKYTPADFHACVAIHDVNAPGRFPDESSADFERYLHELPEGFFVAECQGKIVACAGYTLHSGDYAHLVYGLVHPDWQGQGVGRVLLLLRMSQLSVPEEARMVLTLCAVKASMPYYARHGFKLFFSPWTDAGGRWHPWAYVTLNHRRIQAARDYLAQHHIETAHLAPAMQPPEEPVHRIVWRGRSFVIQDIAPGD